jgi:hypothetical protein
MVKFIVIVIIVILALLGVILYLISKTTRLKGELWGAFQDAHKARAKAESARKKAAEAQEEIQRLTAELDTEMANTGQALAIGKHITYVSQQLRDLMAVIGPLAEHELPGRHVLAASLPAAELPEHLPGKYTRYLPPAPAGHHDGITPSVSDEMVHCMTWEGPESHGA